MLDTWTCVSQMTRYGWSCGVVTGKHSRMSFGIPCKPKMNCNENLNADFNIGEFSPKYSGHSVNFANQTNCMNYRSHFKSIFQYISILDWVVWHWLDHTRGQTKRLNPFVQPSFLSLIMDSVKSAKEHLGNVGKTKMLPSVSFDLLTN